MDKRLSETISNAKPEFKKELGLFSAMTLVMGSMIGSGIFIVSAEVARGVGDPNLLLLTWIFAGLITVVGAASYGKLAAANPEVGGQYVYIRKAWGKLPAFMYGWALIFVIQGGFLAAVGTAFAKFMGVMWPAVSTQHVLFSLAGLELTTAKLVAILSIVSLSIFNIYGVKQGALLQNVFTVLKVGAVLGLIALGLGAGHLFAFERPVLTDTMTMHTLPKLTDLWWLLPMFAVGPLFSSDAWNNVTFVGGEIKQPERIIPQALVYGTVSVTILYLLANMAYLNALPLVAIQNAPEDRVATLLLETLFGPTGAFVMAGAILISTFGCLNGMILAGARVIYAMANDGLFFARFAKLDPKYATPKLALIAQAVWASLLALTGTYLALLDYIVFTALLFYILTVWGSYRLEKQGTLKLTGVWKVLPALYCALITYITLVLAVTKPFNTLPGLFLVLFAIPIYWLWRRFHNEKAALEATS